MSLTEMYESRHSDPNATIMGAGSFDVGGSPGVARRLDSYPRNTPPVTMTPQGRPISRISLPADNLSLIHISEPTRLLSISYAVFCLKKKKKKKNTQKEQVMMKKKKTRSYKTTVSE
eukprot:TRINITY_DN13747_c0_g1_i1.p1 TRINITY_DN13747_c0_g1~~TRINITY_DN13747_c0_g1_i1.p1  ORF type:complete len:117 (+),score=36.38 TRINITY_DN13747_c0_g1_i1:431-781(+)